MKKLIMLIVLVVGGYFAFQYYNDTQYEDLDVEEETVESSYSYDQEPSEPIPEECSELVTNLENALYGNNIGQVSMSAKISAYRKLRSCLRAGGFSGVQIENAITEIEDRVQKYLQQDSGR